MRIDQAYLFLNLVGIVSIILSASCPFSEIGAGDLVFPRVHLPGYFLPPEAAQEALLGEIDKAKEFIFVQANSFTSEPAVTSLIQAGQRGVKVVIFLGKT